MMKKVKYKDFGIVNFIKLTEFEKKLILEWRNDKRISHWMFDQKKISLKNHHNFIENLKTSRSKQYFLVKEKNDSYLGVIYLDHINLSKKTAFLGIYLSPNLIGKGKGFYLLDCLKHIAFKILKLHKLKLEVFAFNKRAIAFYLRNGFVQTKEGFKKTKDKRRKKIIFMELLNGQKPKLKIAVITSKKSWFVPHAKKLASILKKEHDCVFFENHSEAKENFDVVFFLSYFHLVDKTFLCRNKHNIVVHESDLPKGKGWAPLFWQILEGKNRIPIVLFDAKEEMDAGDIFIKDYIVLSGGELHDEIREVQAKKTFDLCQKFLKLYQCDNLRGKRQDGKTSIYPRRTEKNSELDINKTIKEQFNLLRIVDNKNFPAFFWYKNTKYILEIKQASSK